MWKMVTICKNLNMPVNPQSEFKIELMLWESFLARITSLQLLAISRSSFPSFGNVL